MLAIIILSVFIFHSMPTTEFGVVVTVGEFDPDTLEFINEPEPATPDVMDGAFVARMTISNMENMAFFFLPIIVAVAMAMFSTGAVKNELSTGLDRTKLYFSKFTLSAVLCLIFMLLYFLLFVIFATIINGLGYWGDGLLPSLLKSLGSLMVLTLAFNSVGIFLCFATRRTAAVNGLYIALLFVPMMIVSLLALAFPGAINFLNYELMHQFDFLSQVTDLPTAQLIRSFATCLGFILVPMLAGVGLFRRAEIK